MLALALILVVLDIAEGRTPVGELPVLIAALAGVQGGIAGIVGQVANLSQTLSLFSHYTALVDRSRRPAPPGAARQQLAARPAIQPASSQDRTGIRFESVWFRYHDDAPWVLRDLSLLLPPDSVVGLVGLNGAGKSTMASCCAGSTSPPAGASPGMAPTSGNSP
jgi:ATP-binding cassette, subfamily B, bacterial